MDTKTRNKLIAGNIKKLVKENNITQKELARAINISPSTMSDYMNLRSNPSHGVIQKIADYFGVVKSDIDSTYKDQSDISFIYNQLNEIRQHKVYTFAEKQLEEQNKKTVPVVGAIAANPSELEYGDPVYDENISINVPAKADCALIVQGDSMEPLIPNNSIVFYRDQPDVENGEIAVVEIDGNGTTCKKFYFDHEENKVILRSLNEKYEDREIEPERVRVLGKVISA